MPTPKRPSPRPDGKLDVTVVFLEMTGPPQGIVPPPAGLKLALLRAEKPTASFYRYLYQAVGGPWLWVDRQRLGDDALAAILQDERVEISVLYVGGVPAGYGELDYRKWPEVSLAYFGLVTEFHGRGLGPFFLHRLVQDAWSRRPSKIIVNTCNLDHPAALKLYQRIGFRPVATKQVAFDPNL